MPMSYSSSSAFGVWAFVVVVVFAEVFQFQNRVIHDKHDSAFMF